MRKLVAVFGQRDLEVRIGFLRGGARPPTDEMIPYIDRNKERFGVEPICRLLPTAPSTYYEARSSPPSAHALRDEELKPEIGREALDALEMATSQARALRSRSRAPASTGSCSKVPTKGRANVFIDGKLVKTVDGYAPQPAFGVVRSFTGLAEGIHTIRIVALGSARRAASGTRVSIDRFAVR